MKQKRNKQILPGFILKYATCSVIFFLYLATFIFTGFFFHIYINSWTLIVAFVSYAVIGAIYLLIRKASKEKLLLFSAGIVLTPLIVWGLFMVFGRTYDTSFDGQDYHQSAIIELSDGWNPIYQKSMPIKLLPNTLDQPIDSGYAKIVWSIDASIYKVTHNIDSATAINLIVGILAFIFLYFALLSLSLSEGSSAIIALLGVVTTIFVEQLLTSREDSVGYSFLIIGVSSIVLLLKAKNKLSYFLCLLTALIFLAGIKYSDLFIFLPLLVLSLYIVITKRYYRLKSFKLTVAIGLVTGFITLFNPYITNLHWYHAVDYPYNQKIYSSLLRYNSVPENINKDGRLKLFYYGVFSSAVIGNTQSSADYAHIKAPFTFSYNEMLVEGSSPSKFVGGYGVLFSGIFILSIAIYLYIALRKKNKAETTIFTWLSIALVLIIVSCLLSPIPSYARYSDQLSFFPIAAAIALMLMARNGWKLGKNLSVILIVLISMNLFIDIVSATAETLVNFDNIGSQLLGLKQSNVTYLVNASDFYSNYTRLESRGVKIVISQKPVNCKYVITLDDSSDSTKLCKLDLSTQPLAPPDNTADN